MNELFKLLNTTLNPDPKSEYGDPIPNNEVNLITLLEVLYYIILLLLVYLSSY